mgnify:CR=1 FL=1|tara:strand:- start:2442 stop:2810 length:369 start_codon:yes stop_codon:yes gene_type:complete
MSYRTASRQKLRIQTNKGLLSVEQLWDLSLNDLDTSAVALEKSYKESGKKSFLVKKSKKDKDLKLALDIILDVLNTKVEERDERADAAGVKAHNEKILARIAKKKDDELDELSVKDLEKLLK